MLLVDMDLRLMMKIVQAPNFVISSQGVWKSTWKIHKYMTFKPTSSQNKREPPVENEKVRTYEIWQTWQKDWSIKTSNYLFNRSLKEFSPVQKVEGGEVKAERVRVGAGEPSDSTTTDANTILATTSTTK